MPHTEEILNGAEGEMIAVGQSGWEVHRCDTRWLPLGLNSESTGPANEWNVDVKERSPERPQGFGTGHQGQRGR